MIDNNIIQSLGAGSGIDTKSLVKQLTDIERAAPQERIDARTEKAEAQISDYAIMRGAMNTLKESLTALTEKEGLYSKSASFTDSDALAPSELTTDVQPGSYSFVVEKLAQSQSVNFGALTDPTDAVGEGTLTLSFGTWNRDGSEVITTFAADAERETVDIVIDSSNNSLEGLRDAINEKDIGVQASIVFDGSGYVLSLLAESGGSNEIYITADEGGAASDDLDATGLSRFAFNENLSVTNFTTLETQRGQDAELKINGLDVTRSSNVVDDVVEGLTVNLLKEAPTETITVTVTDDKAFAEEKIRDFVDAYNTFLEEIEPVFAYDEEEEEYGSLRNDSLAKSVTSQFRNLIANVIPGLASSDYTSLTNIGIRTELDGTISIEEDDFELAMDNNFEDVQKLLAPLAESTASGIDVNSYGTQTQPGNYDVVITTQPEKGVYTGNAVAGFPTLTGQTYTFVATVNGVASDTITIPSDVAYNDGDTLALAIQTAINADENLTEGGASVVVRYDVDHFEITSNKYGSASNVVISATTGDVNTDLGLVDASGSSGTDVAGTVGGEVGFGLGHVLLGKLGSDAEGLSLIVDENATTSTINFSRGFSGEFERSIDDFLQRNGLFDNRKSNLETQLSGYESDQERLDRRMTAFEERTLQQFIAMETILNSLNSSGGFLENLIDTLPFTASRN